MQETVEWVINRSFELNPDTIVIVVCGEKIKAVLDKDSWENDKNLQRRRLEFRHIKAPAFFEMGEMPVIGRFVKINYENCEQI